MNRSVPMIGLSADEIPWIRRLVALLRHPDPTIPELARQALVYLSGISESTALPGSRNVPKHSVLQCLE